jgi:membrane protease YdiL (CAAX protease family)
VNGLTRPAWLARTLALTALAALAYLPIVLAGRVPSGLLVGGWATVIVGLLAGALLARRSERYAIYSRALYGLFAASLAALADGLRPKQLVIDALGVSSDSPQGVAIMLLESAVVIVGTILILLLVIGERPGSVLLQRGRVRAWLPIGIASIVFFAVTSITAATALFQGRDLTWDAVLGWAPWIALFVLCNGLREEVWFRGVMLPRYGPLIGAPAAVFCSALVFAVAHSGVTYTPMLLPFIAITFVLGLVFGTLAQRTDSVWGAALVHAGADIPVVIGMMSNL